MTSGQAWDEHQGKIVEFVSANERSNAADLARYWDAALRGEPNAPDALDRELALVVQLLRHYHGLVRSNQGALDAICSPHTLRSTNRTPGSDPSASPKTGDRKEPQKPARPMTRAAVGLVAIFLVIFAVNSVTSPRSWLVTQNDPDWIPWVSDDWIGTVWDGL